MNQLFFYITKNSKSLWLLLFFYCNILKAQNNYNLVPNYSFETFTVCPQILVSYLPPSWFRPTNSTFYYWGPYFNSCDTTNKLSVPINYAGFQKAKTGSAYASLQNYSSVYNSGRYYLATQLNDTLKKNKLYQVIFYVSLADFVDQACNNMAAYISKNKIYVDTTNDEHGVILLTPQIINYSNPIISDTMNWTKVSGIFKAEGGEGYLTIGNFQYDINTSVKNMPTTPNSRNGAGYYIDDVSVIPLDSFCLKADAGKDTTIKKGDSIFIGSYTNGIDSLRWLQNNTVIDSTRPGFWVKPTTATSYVLCQVVNGCATCDTINIGLALPLKFTSFTCVSSLRGTKQSAELNWQTTNETNVSHFNILRSTNAKDFTTITTVKANNKSTNEYSVVDNSPLSPPMEGSGVAWLGVVYYRIESIDFNGSKQYSQTKQINFSTNQQITIYPNPAKDIINISSKATIKEIKLINQLGQVVKQKTFSTPTNSHLWNVGEAKGIYILQITNTNNLTTSQKIIFDY